MFDRVQKLRIFHKYLNNGYVFTYKDMSYYLLEDGNLGWNTDSSTNWAYRCDVPFNEILEMLDKVPDLEFVAMAANNALSRE